MELIKKYEKANKETRGCIALVETAPELLKMCQLSLKAVKLLAKVSSGEVQADAEMLVNSLEDVIAKAEGR